MRKLIFLFLFLKSKISYTQQFIAGNVFVSSNSCDYTITGNYTDSINISQQMSFVYDSALVGWKFIIPDSSNLYATVCVSSIFCGCPSICQTQQVLPGLTFTINICDVVSVSEVYPNPFNDLLNVNCDSECTLDIYDQLGRRVILKKIDNFKYDTSDLPTGVYYIFINNKKINKKYIFFKTST